MKSSSAGKIFFVRRAISLDQKFYQMKMTTRGRYVHGCHLVSIFEMGNLLDIGTFIQKYFYDFAKVTSDRETKKCIFITFDLTINIDATTTLKEKSFYFFQVVIAN